MAGWNLEQRAGSRVPQGTSAISGVVVDAVTESPLEGCSVLAALLVNFRPSGSSETITGPDGAYSFSEIADGEYAVNVFCNRHLPLPSCYRNPGTDSPRCDNVSIAVDQHRSNIDFALVPEAIARGRVVDPDGRPIPRATVRLGTPVQDTAFITTKPAETDREGAFELSGLPAGEWRLEVELPAEPDAPRPPVIYFPGVLAQSDAGSVELVAGNTLDDIVIVAPSLEENRLTVRLVTLEAALAKVDLSLVRLEPFLSRRIVVDDTGAGTVTGLAPGRYVLSARGYTSERLSVAYDAIDVIGGPQEVLLYLKPTARITGRITVERGEALSLDGARIGAAWIHDGVEVNPLAVDETAVDADSTFRFDGLFGTRQLRIFGLDPTFEVKAVLHGRTDVTAGLALVADTEATVVIVVGRR